VKVRIFDLDDDVFPEMAARAAFLREGSGDPGTRRVIAPRGSVRRIGDRTVVLIVEGETAKAVEVETGSEGDDGVEIRRGLLGGERAITGGAEVMDGQKVMVGDKK
jgi:multidrug efflux pump subunit AcrA (membrane-fusion protein)